MNELYTAYIIIGLVWLLITYAMGNDPTHIFDDDNSFKYRIFKGIMLQAMFGAAVAISVLVAWAFFMVL